MRRLLVGVALAGAAVGGGIVVNAAGSTAPQVRACVGTDGIVRVGTACTKLRGATPLKLSTGDTDTDTDTYWDFQHPTRIEATLHLDPGQSDLARLECTPTEDGPRSLVPGEHPISFGIADGTTSVTDSVFFDAEHWQWDVVATNHSTTADDDISFTAYCVQQRSSP